MIYLTILHVSIMLLILIAEIFTMDTTRMILQALKNTSHGDNQE